MPHGALNHQRSSAGARGIYCIHAPAVLKDTTQAGVQFREFTGMFPRASLSIHAALSLQCFLPMETAKSL